MTEQERKERAGGSFTTGQSWGALRKAWKGYRIAKVQGDLPKLKEYAHKIRKLQHELGLLLSTFPEIDITSSRYEKSKEG